MSIPVVFLDIDGVLVTQRTLKGRSGLRAIADPDCVAALNKLTDATGAKLVISSSWRFCGLEEMRLILCHWGVKADVVGCTPDFTQKQGQVFSAVPRGREIAAWIKENNPSAYVILDDEADMEELDSALVRTRFETGFLDWMVDIAKRVLQKPLDNPPAT